jgi:hypothetical protein
MGIAMTTFVEDIFNSFMKVSLLIGDRLYSGEFETPPISKETFMKLLKMSSTNVVMAIPMMDTMYKRMGWPWDHLPLHC